jgi:tetratricopeptide (TPR) repeat protein
MGWCFKQEGQLENALKCYEQLILLQKSDSNYFELGEIYYSQRNDPKAIASWLNALECCTAESPHLFDLYKGLGNSFTRTGDFESAEENYNKALTIRPRSDVLQVNIGTLEYQRQKFIPAMNHYKQALEINPHNDRAWSGVALVARQMGDREWGKATLLKALDINPYNPVALEILVEWAEADKNFDDAIERIQTFTEKFQNNGNMIAALAGLLFQKNDLDGAESELIQLEALDPHRPEILELRHLIAQRKSHGP